MTERPEVRSRTMRAVKGRDTGPEMTVRRLAHGMGYRYRLHRKDLPGKPDYRFPRKTKTNLRARLFLASARLPERGALAEIEPGLLDPQTVSATGGATLQNQKRLREMGWGVMVIWECEMKEQEELRGSHFEAFLGRSRNGS